MSATAAKRKGPWVRVGDFFFKYRNAVFPVILLTLFIAFRPPSGYLSDTRLEEWKDVLAVLLALGGVVFRAAVIGFAYIKRGGVDKRVYADELVTDGFFATCRNPLYVGNMLIYSGVFLMHGHPAVILLGVTSYWLIYESIIGAEEYFLRGKFGEAYAAYCRDVPRWLPHLGRLKEATRGMRFNFKRVLMKDYTTMANAAMALLLLEMLEDFYALPQQVFLQELAPILTLIALVLGATGAIALAKRRKWLRL